MTRYILAALVAALMGLSAFATVQTLRARALEATLSAEKAETARLTREVATAAQRAAQAQQAAAILHRQLAEAEARSTEFAAIRDAIRKEPDHDPIPDALRLAVDRLCQRDPACRDAAGGARRAPPVAPAMPDPGRPR